MKPTALLIALTAAVALLGPAASARQIDEEDAAQIPGLTVLARLKEGRITPEQAAAEAARRGDFRMFWIHRVRGSNYIPGVVCATPGGHPPGILMSEGRGDYVVFPDPPREQFDALAPRYNRAVLAAPEFPWPDLCAASDSRGDAPTLAKALGPAPRRPRDLWAAARYGKPAEVRRFLRSTPVDQDDVFGMTALAWATARGRADIVDILLATGADPLAAKGRFGDWSSPLNVAVQTGRPELLDPLLAGRKVQGPWRWRSFHVNAAIATGNAALLRRILREPHDDPGQIWLPPDLPLDLAEALAGSPDKTLGVSVLLLGADNGRPDLVRLALKHGVSPNAARSHETALALAAKGLRGEADVESVRLLIAAGADVNLRNPNEKWGETPIWDVAAGFMTYRQRTWSSQETILNLLLDAGADLKGRSRTGVPLIWRLLFLPRVEKDEIGSAPPPRIIALLAARGMEVNVPWNGAMPLDWVDETLGPTSEMSTTLRAAGAVNSRP